VYRGIADALVAEALVSPTGEVVYAVPGSPLVAEKSVELLRADDRIEVVVMAGVSFADVAFARLGVDPLACGARIVDGHRFRVEAAGYAGPMLVGQCDSPEVLSEVKLVIGDVLDQLPGDHEAQSLRLTVLQRLGLPEQAVTELAWHELDREIVPDHLTSVWVPSLPAGFASEMTRLQEVGRVLRERCPWDRKQTHQSLTRYLIEESYEVIEAIDELGPDGEGYDHLEEELGDVLFQVVFHSTLAAEEGQFTLGDVARRVHDKLVARHPHVFGDVEAATAEDVARNWEQIKRAERGEGAAAAPSIMDGLPRDLPSLLYAYKVHARAASVGFDWPDTAGVLAKVDEELAELREAGSPAEIRDELGDLLFATVSLARHLDVEPEGALREAAGKFCRRFKKVEELARAQNLRLEEMSLEAMDGLWEQVKAAESASGPETSA
jgi:tetrapyrrole methylase family protein/MazG family protein